MDLDRRITSWSSGAQQILGYAREEALGKLADIIFTPEDRAAGAAEMEAQRALDDGRAMDQRWHLRKDGSTFWSNGTLMAMHDVSGQAVGFVKILRDETNELRAKQALEKSREELLSAFRETERARSEAVEAGRAKDHFLAVLSHELRTPLTPVLMAARTLSRRKDLPSEANETLAMIERNVQLESHAASWSWCSSEPTYTTQFCAPWRSADPRSNPKRRRSSSSSRPRITSSTATAAGFSRCSGTYSRTPRNSRPGAALSAWFRATRGRRSSSRCRTRGWASSPATGHVYSLPSSKPTSRSAVTLAAWGWGSRS